LVSVYSHSRLLIYLPDPPLFLLPGLLKRAPPGKGSFCILLCGFVSTYSTFTKMISPEKEFYSSHTKLPFISERGQAQLLQSRVLVIGAGGLGCPCLLALAGAGIGILGIADFDAVSVSNLHRQHLYTLPDEGKKKTVVARERLAKYNPFIHIQTHDVLVYEKTVLPLLEGYDVIVDCTDNFLARYLINDACIYLNKPLVYGAIHRAEGHVTVFNCDGSGTLRCLFPNDESDSTQSCADIGAYNITTGIIGLMMANEAVKIITGSKDVLAGKLWSIDSLTGSTMLLKYQLNPQSRLKSKQRFELVIK
jgi:sulfur-carrier protein adenylyltransferase/sulfurtransferase